MWPAQGPWGMGLRLDRSRTRSATLQMGDLLQLNMTPGQIAASGAPAWQQAIMRAMARYGMYINDTNGGADNQGLELDTQDDESFTSLGEPPQMADAVQSPRRQRGGLGRLDGRRRGDQPGEAPRGRRVRAAGHVPRHRASAPVAQDASPQRATITSATTISGAADRRPRP